MEFPIELVTGGSAGGGLLAFLIYLLNRDKKSSDKRHELYETQLKSFNEKLTKLTEALTEMNLELTKITTAVDILLIKKEMKKTV